MQEKAEFERDYFYKTFRGYFSKTVLQLELEASDPHQMLGLLDIQKHLADLFYKSLPKKALELAIAEQIRLHLKKQSSPKGQDQSDYRILQLHVFLELYYWFIQSNYAHKISIPTQDQNRVLDLAGRLKLRSQFESMGGAQDLVEVVLRQLMSMGRFSFSFKELLVSLSHRHDLNLSQFVGEMAVSAKNPKKPDELQKSDLEKEDFSQSATKSLGFHHLIKNDPTPSKPSLARSQNSSSSRRSTGRTMQISHPMRFLVPQKQTAKVVTEYVKGT